MDKAGALTDNELHDVYYAAGGGHRAGLRAVCSAARYALLAKLADDNQPLVEECKRRLSSLMVTEVEARRREREAFVAGVDSAYEHRVFTSPSAEAARRYPPQKVTRPRIVRVEVGPGQINAWKRNEQGGYWMRQQGPDSWVSDTPPWEHPTEEVDE